ncbi:MAG TPA: ion channel [Rhizomicrobium sp.]|nr:ion channel [Rhizomicrobium sp.]
MKKRTKLPRPQKKPLTLSQAVISRRPQRLAIIKGQDNTRWTDFYHAVLTAPWWLFFVGTALFFLTLNALFALFYMADPHGLSHARPGSFWDAFLFSVETITSVDKSDVAPVSIYANIVVVTEAFFGILNLAMITGIMFARFSRPYSRVLFSKVAVITPFDGTPTLMFRAANQRGNSILDASISVSLARQVTTREGIVMRRFEELALLRSRSPLFALSWTIMHRIDETSPLHGLTLDTMHSNQVELVILLSGTDDTLADVIYARHAYGPDNILWDHRFVDVLSLNHQGKRVVDLNKFHDTKPID